METLVKPTVTPTTFNSDWWSSFLQKTRDMTSTAVIENVLTEDDLAFLNGEVMKILQLIYMKKTNQYGLRVYIEGKEQDSKYLNGLFGQPPLDGEDSTTYFNRILPGTKFGFVINRTEKFSNEMTKFLTERIQPLIDKMGMPLAGLRTDLFIGNYGWTPFGIHRDIKGEHITHFHLGPGRKTIYTWDDEIYKEKAAGKQGNKNVEPMLEFGKKYEFGPGDLYYMPSEVWHVGYSDELSIALVFDYLNPTQNVFLSNVYNSLTLQYMSKDKTVLEPQHDLGSKENFNYVQEQIQLDESKYNLTFEELMKQLYREYKYAIMSNCGWENLPLTLQDLSGYNIDDFELLRGKTVITPAPFKLIAEQEGDQLVVFARGYKIKIKYHAAFIEIIGILNTNKAQVVEELLAPLTVEWPVEAGLYFLSMLYDKRAIEITS